MTGYSADKIRRCAKNGTIPAFRYADGADWRFDADEVHRWTPVAAEDVQAGDVVEVVPASEATSDLKGDAAH